MIYLRYNEDGTLKSSVDKFYPEDDLKLGLKRCNAKPEFNLVLAGETEKTQNQLSDLRLEISITTWFKRQK